MSDAAGNIVNKKKKMFKKRPLQRKKKLATIQQVKRLISKRAETKYCDIVQAAVGVSNAGTVWDLSQMGPGTSQNSRIGITIEALWLEIMFATVIADATNFMRYVVFVWNNDTAGVTPTLAAVLANGNNCETLQYVTTNAKDCTVLLDVCHKLTGVSNPTERTRHMVPLRGRRIEYTSGLTTGNRHIYLVAVSDSGAVAHPSTEFASRIAFKDS